MYARGKFGMRLEIATIRAELSMLLSRMNVYLHKRNKYNLDNHSGRIISSVIIYPVAKNIIEFRCKSACRRRCLLS